MSDLIYIRGCQDTLDDLLNWCNSLSEQLINKKDVYKYIFSIRPIDQLNKHYDSLQHYRNRINEGDNSWKSRHN